MEPDEYGRTPWRMTSTITDPDGVRVQVTITVPIGKEWDGTTADATEIAQMMASQALKHLNQCRKIAADKVPF